MYVFFPTHIAAFTFMLLKMHITLLLRLFISFIDDHSRVILKSKSSTEGDYINANYIEASI